MDTKQFKLWQQKISPSGRYICNIYQLEKSMLFSLELVTKETGHVFFHIDEKDGWITPKDMFVWEEKQDVLFFSTGEWKRVFVYDIPHRQYQTMEVPEGQVVVRDSVAKWLFKKKLFSSEGRSYYSTEDALELKDVMETQPQAKILPLPQNGLALWLRKKHIVQYDRPVWQVALYATETKQLLTDDLGLYAIEDSIRITKTGYINFYGYKADETAFFWVNYHPGDRELHLLEYPDVLPITEMQWVEEDDFWRAVINGVIIRPRPFYFDNTYSLPVTLGATPMPLELLELADPEGEQTKRLRDERAAQRRVETRKRHEADNTSMDDLLKRADSGTQFFQRLKAKWLPSRSEREARNGGRKHEKLSSPMSGGGMSLVDSIMYFILATLAFIGLIVVAVAHVANGGRLGPSVIRNIGTIGAAIVAAWVGLLVNMKNNKGNTDGPLSMKAKVIIIVFVFVAFFVGMFVYLKFN